MLDQWVKVTTIAAAVVIIASAVVAPSVGVIVWLARLDSDVTRLQEDVKQLQADVAGLQEGMREILDFLQSLANDNLRIWDNLSGHTHGADGGARLPLGR